MFKKEKFLLNKNLKKNKNINHLKSIIALIFALSAFVSVSTIIRTEVYWSDKNKRVGTSNHSQNPEVTPEIDENNTVKVGNYKANLVYGTEQDIVDMPNTAALFYYEGRPYIADHSYQGFSAIRWNKTAEVSGKLYRLVSRYYASWGDAIQGRTIYLPTGEEMWYCNDGSLVMYTCVGTGAVVTYWDYE